MHKENIESILGQGKCFYSNLVLDKREKEKKEREVKERK